MNASNVKYKLLKLVKRLVKLIVNFIKAFSYFYRDGGVTYAQISQIHYSNLLQSKNVLITGGSSGIGLAIAQKAISMGAQVVITGRNLKKLESAKNHINNENLHILQWDMSNISILKNNLLSASELVGGSFDILINNAGILLDQNFYTVSESVWDETYNVNSKSTYFLSQAFSNILIDKKLPGKIINISSTSAFYGASIPYGLSKWDVAGMTEGLGKKLSSHGIVVNGIAPGRTATSMLNKGNNDNIYDSKTSANRFATPEEIAELAAFLMSDAANFIVGQTIVCDGGYILKTH